MSAEPIARERILESAYDLFSTKGVRAVGIEEVIERADEQHEGHDGWRIDESW